MVDRVMMKDVQHLLYSVVHSIRSVKTVFETTREIGN